MKKYNPAAAARSSASARGSRSGALSRPRPPSQYMGAEEKAAHRRSERLIQHMADIGVHPVAISRRIQERLPSAWEVLGGGRMVDDVSVKTAYNTKWGYHISKEGGGWVVRFVPDDLSEREIRGGQLGGYLTSRGLSHLPEVFGTRKAAYDLLAQHAMKGRYLQYKNPKRNPSDWALAYEGRLRDLTGESDGLIHVNPKGRRGRAAPAGKRAKYVSAQAAGLARGQSLMAQAAAAYHAGHYPTMQAALKGVAARKNPSHARHGGSATTHARGLRKGQSLMSQAAAAYHAGKYPNMAAALKGVSKKGRR